MVLAICDLRLTICFRLFRNHFFLENQENCKWKKNNLKEEISFFLLKINYTLVIEYYFINMKIIFATLKLSTLKNTFCSSQQCHYFSSYILLFVLFTCYLATKGMMSKLVLLFSLIWKRHVELNTIDF